jgi:hypothetical protein
MLSDIDAACVALKSPLDKKTVRADTKIHKKIL